MSLADVLVRIVTDALPKVIELIVKIASSSDQRGSAEKALQALETDALDAVTDKALDETLARLNKRSNTGE